MDYDDHYESTPVGENVDPHRLTELQHSLLEWAVLTSADVDAFGEVW